MIMETKLWRLYVSFFTDKIYERVFIGYVVAENSEEAVRKQEEWAKNKDPFTYILNQSYKERCYKGLSISPEKVRKARFCVGAIINSQPLTDRDIIVV